MPKFLDSLVQAMEANEPLRYLLIAGLVVIASVIAYAITKRVLLRIISFVVRKSATQWDDILLERGIFDIVAWLAPGLVIYYAAFQFEGQTEAVIQRLVVGYMEVVMIRVLLAFLGGVGDIWATTSRAKNVPIKGYLQVAQILIAVLGAIIIFAGIIDRSPWALLSGIGAATAVILLVFKDTILSFVASIQIASTGSIRLGDWISMPKYDADGDVIDIALHRVTVQNWNKTLTAIPTHKFLDEAFTNWRGMSECGGRRIMRTVFLDQTSVHFLKPDELERLSKVQLLKSYLGEASADVESWNSAHDVDESVLMNGRRLTNLGSFRAYMLGYLKANPNIHQDMTFLVRQLAPSPEGVGIQIYVFANDTAWVKYEDIQADIFDHVLAALPEFGLRIFQNPTGLDMRALGGKDLS